MEKLADKMVRIIASSASWMRSTLVATHPRRMQLMQLQLLQL
jgi:hypothetical protein